MKKRLTFLLALLCVSVLGWADPVSYCGETVQSTIDNTSYSITVTVQRSGDKTLLVKFESPYIASMRAGGTFQRWGDGAVWSNQDDAVANFASGWTQNGNEWSKEFTFSTYPVSGTGQIYALFNLTEGVPAVAGFTLTDVDLFETCSIFVDDDPDPTEVYDTNFALSSNGATASAQSGNVASNANDGNAGTRWWSATDDMTNDEKNDQWWQVDLGRRRIFNTIQIVWEGAWGKSFDIKISNDGEEWTTVKEIRNQSIPGPFPYTQTIELDATQTARYVRFKGIERGTGYAYSFWEFRVYMPSVSVLTSIELSPAVSLAEVDGTGVTLTPLPKDQNGVEMAADISYEITPAAAGHMSGNTYIPDQIGDASIVAYNGAVRSSAVTVCGYEGADVALNKDVEASGYDDVNKLYPSFAVDADNGSLWSARAGETGDERVYDAWIIVDLGAYYDINVVAIRWEGACSRHYHVDFSSDKSTWRTAYNAGWNAIATHWEFLSGTDIDATKVRYVRVWSTEAVSQYGVKIMALRVFGTEWVAPVDTEKPVMVSASLVSVTDETATLAVAATDNTEVGHYHVVDEANSVDQTILADANIIITGLSSSTSYRFIVTALDLRDNESENSVIVNATTDRDSNRPWASAPVPYHNADLVRAVYSDTYVSALKHDFSKNSWSWIPNISLDIDGDHCIHYNTSTDKWFALGSNNDGADAIIAKDEFTAGGENKGLDVSQLAYLHIDVWTKASSTGPVININDDRLAVYNIEGEGWHSYDFPLSALTEDKLINVRWLKFEGFNGLNSIALDNVYFWQYGAKASADSWGTFASPVAVKVPAGVTVYKAVYEKNGDDETLTLTDAGNVIPANTGVLLSMTDASASYAFTLATSDEATAAATNFSGNSLVGCATRTDISSVAATNDIFCLRRSDLFGMSGFFLYTGQFIPAGKAYLPVPKEDATPAPSRRIRFVYDTTTALDNVESSAMLGGQKILRNGQLLIRRGDAVYTIQGVRVE